MVIISICAALPAQPIWSGSLVLLEHTGMSPAVPEGEFAQWGHLQPNPAEHDHPPQSHSHDSFHVAARKRITGKALQGEE